jgi:hypothetical protein
MEGELCFSVYLNSPGKRVMLPPLPPSSQVGLLPPSPLGTDRESFPSISSSLPNALLRTRFHVSPSQYVPAADGRFGRLCST